MGQPATALSLYSNDRSNSLLGRILTILAKVSFSIALISFPFRFRFTIVERPHPPIYRDYSDILIFLADTFLIATLIFWIGSIVIQKKKVSLKPVALTFALAILTMVIFVSTIFSTDPVLSAYYLIRTLALFGMYLFIVNEIRSLNVIALALAIQIFIQSTVAIGQAWQQSSLGLGIFGEHNLDPLMSGVSIIGAGNTRTLRAYGITDHPNILGGSLALGLILYLGWLVYKIHASDFSRSSLVLIIPSIGIFGLGASALFLTYSRSAWLALSLGLFFFLAMFWISRQYAHAKTTAALLAGSLILLIPIGLQNLGNISARINVENSFQSVYYEKNSLDERAALSQAGNEIFSRNAVLGVGPGVFPFALQDQFPGFQYDFQPPHIVLLEAAAETGIFGALVVTVLLVLPWAALRINRRLLQFNSQLIIASGALLAVSAIGFFDYYPWLLPPGRYWLWAIWGLWGAIYIRSFQANSND